MATILIVDDDLLFCEALGSTLEQAGHRVLAAHTLGRARVLLKKQRTDMAFIDVMLPDGNGLDLLAGLALLPDPPEAVVITAQGDPEGAETAITGGAWDYVQKPAHMGQIMLMVERALEARIRKLQMPDFSSLSGMVASSRPMRKTLVQMFEAAQSEAPVLITGETGTGKELVARAIHKNSRRNSGPFVVVDCGAITPTLLESELFGNVRGAFTGAVHARQGLAMLADGGTLFLDEVGELASAQQKVFLRLLQERSFRPIGGVEELRSNFRVVAATNRNLAEMASAGTFRPDLLFRLRGMLIEVPPVRQRGGDMDLLVQFALGRTVTHYGMREKSFSTDALDALASYSWPGNVREMLHTVEAAALTAGEAPLILLQHLPVHLRAQAVRSRLEERGQEARRNGSPPPAHAGLPAEGAGEAGERLPPLPPRSASAASAPGLFSAPGALRAPALGVHPLPADEPPGPASLRMRTDAGEAAVSPGPWKEFQDTTLHQLKRRYLLDLLLFAQGNVPLAARTAGLSRQRLYTLLREHGISREWES